MALVSIEESPDREGGQNNLWQRTYRRKYIVITDDPYDGPVFIGQQLPYFIGNYYRLVDNMGVTREHDFSSFVNSLAIRCVSKDACQWEAVLEYGPYNPQIFQANPISWPIKIAWGGTKFERVYQYDINGIAITNSAGQYFDPPVVGDDSRINLKIERNEPVYNPAIAAAYKDAVNSDVFFGGNPGTWKLALPTADLEYNVDSGTPDGFYYRITYNFEYRIEGWQALILDQGTMVLDGGNRLTNALGSDGAPVSSPIPLNGAGKALPAGGTPTFLAFDIYTPMPFAQLNLDPTFAPGQI
jgi:hypothetical protein